MCKDEKGKQDPACHGSQGPALCSPEISGYSVNEFVLVETLHAPGLSRILAPLPATPDLLQPPPAPAPPDAPSPQPRVLLQVPSSIGISNMTLYE